MGLGDSSVLDFILRNAFSPTVMMYAWGEITPETLQHAMVLFKQDMARYMAGELDLDLVDRLNGLGSGEFGGSAGDGNVSRDLYRRLPATNMPEPHSLKVPLVQKSTGRLYEAEMDMVLPHELFACLFHFYKEAFFRFVVPAVDVVERFWKSVAGDAFSFCVCGLIRSFALEMLTLSYTIQSLLF